MPHLLFYMPSILSRNFSDSLRMRSSRMPPRSRTKQTILLTFTTGYPLPPALTLSSGNSLVKDAFANRTQIPRSQYEYQTFDIRHKIILFCVRECSIESLSLFAFAVYFLTIRKICFFLFINV